jgi:hypothetical protein
MAALVGGLLAPPRRPQPATQTYPWSEVRRRGGIPLLDFIHSQRPAEHAGDELMTQGPVAAGHSLNSFREIDGSCVPAANQNRDALASRRAVALREQGGEGCRPSRLGDNAENTP